MSQHGINIFLAIKIVLKYDIFDADTINDYDKDKLTYETLHVYYYEQ